MKRSGWPEWQGASVSVWRLTCRSPAARFCGASLRSVGKEEVAGKVPSGTLSHYGEFWACTGCGKVYWRGSHWKNISETLDKAKELADKLMS